MIQKFIERWEKNKGILRARFEKEFYNNYKDIVIELVKILADEDDYGESPDPARVHEIDDGDYQGTVVYVIGANDYQPSMYWYTSVSYGSCSGCDTLQSINDIQGNFPTEKQVDDYMTLTLHLLQNLKEMK